MSQTILDSDEEEKDNQYARKSFKQFMISLSSYLPLIIIVIFGGMRSRYIE